ncbi:hypothetical protein ACFLV0_07070 [Chloroflexota bacterium]
MKTKDSMKTNPDWVTASLSPESLDRLTDMVLTKLTVKNENGLITK